MLLRRYVRFGVTGAAASSIHVIFVIFVVEVLGSDPVIANGLAFCAATAFSYFLNTFWSFSAPKKHAHATRYVLVTACSAALSMAIANTAKVIGLNYLFGIFIIILIVPPITFLGHNYWTFRQ